MQLEQISLISAHMHSDLNNNRNEVVEESFARLDSNTQDC